MTTPVLTPPPLDALSRWEAQVAATGCCTHPIRLRGRIDAIDLQTGETRPMYSTDAEPGGVLLTACGNRRESVCPSCSATYKRDARQLVKAGLAGGKGIPESIAAHPCVFATFTAPSFGPVHSARRLNGRLLPCRPRRDQHARRCPHGRDISCGQRHHDDDPQLGRPLCPDCYDYEAAVLFNACAGELWRRFTIYLPRRLAALAGITQKRLRALARVRYVKVAEYQARGAIHYHAVIRLDAPGESYQPPPARFTADLLSDAIRQAAAAVALDLGADRDHPGVPALTLRFGAQTDPRPIRHHHTTGRQLTIRAVANYIAKYATKSLTAPGLPDRRLRNTAEVDELTCSAHYRQIIATAWRLGHPAACGDSLRRWAHMLGFGGHFMTKSGRYSVTFGQLRAARREHRRTQHHPDGETDPWGRPLDDTVVLVLKTWVCTGTGYTSAAEADLAKAAAARARGHELWPHQAA
jgi:Replication initiator protein, pSAM2